MLLIPLLQLDPGVLIAVYWPLIFSLHAAPPKHGRCAPLHTVTTEKHQILACEKTNASILVPHMVSADGKGITSEYLRSAILKQVARRSYLAEATDLFGLCKHLMDVPLHRRRVWHTEAAVTDSMDWMDAVAGVDSNWVPANLSLESSTLQRR